MEESLILACRHPQGLGFGIEPAISAAPTINSGLNLGERSTPLESGVLAKASGGAITPEHLHSRDGW